MNIEEQIRQSLKRWCETYGPAPTILATVVSVDEDNSTCILKDDDENEIPDVRLRPVLDGNESMTIFPKAGTWCLAIRIEKEEQWMLIAAGEFEKWKMKIGTTIIEQNATGLLVQKDTDTLKEILLLLCGAMKQIVVVYGNNPDYVKIETAVTKINNLLR